ncbi:unnamed protein product, partial [Ectocarpus sp. 8 AP-2014]
SKKTKVRRGRATGAFGRYSPQTLCRRHPRIPTLRGHAALVTTRALCMLRRRSKPPTYDYAQAHAAAHEMVTPRFSRKTLKTKNMLLRCLIAIPQSLNSSTSSPLPPPH